MQGRQWKDRAMDATLFEQIESTIDALTLSHTQAAQVRQKMKQQHISFGLNYDNVDDDITQLISRLRYVKRLAERREAAGG
jgi:hypothetical protein